MPEVVIEEMTHSEMSPSGSNRWLACPASVPYSRGIQESGSNAAAQRGTFIHAVGEGLLLGEKMEIGRSITDPRAKKMTYIDAEMMREAQQYHDYVKDLMTEPDAELFVEVKVYIFPDEDISGHIDACVMNGTTLHICDLKTGRQPVSAIENSQMMLYAIGMVEEQSLFYDIENVHLHIIQDNPSVHNINSWECSIDDLEDFAEYAQTRAQQAMSDNPEAVPGDKQCQYCLASATCPALLKETTKLFDDLEEASDGDGVSSADLELVIKILSKRKLLDIALKAYDDRVYNELIEGNKVEGFKLVQKRTNKKWLDQIDAMQKIKSWLPIDEVAPRKLITPTQTEKLLGKISTKKANIFNSLWERPEGQLIVAPESDKREAINPVGEFDDITGD